VGGRAGINFCSLGGRNLVIGEVTPHQLSHHYHHDGRCTEFLRALGNEKGRVHNLNSNPGVCHTNILIPESQVALVETSINTTKNRFRLCTHPTCMNTYFVPKPRLWYYGTTWTW